MWTENFQMYWKLDLEKAEEPEINLPTSVGSQKKQGNSRKTSASLTMLKLWLCGSQQTGNFFKRWEYQTTLTASREICMEVKKQQLELDMGQQTGTKSAKEYLKAVYYHPAYLIYMQSTSWECSWVEEAQAGIKIAGRNINNLRYADDHPFLPPLWEKAKKN